MEIKGQAGQFQWNDTMIRVLEKRSHADEIRSPVLWEVTAGTTAALDQIQAWLGDMQPDIARTLRQDGALCIRGFERLQSAPDFGAALSAICPELMDYVGGTSPRDVLHGKVMTATKLPANFSIPLHQEMSYTDGFPMQIAFFGAEPPANGGETTTGDMRVLTQMLDSDFRERFARKGGVQLRRTLPTPESLHLKPGVAKSWHETFGTTQRDQAEEIAARRGWTIDWLADGSLQLWQEIRPLTISHPQTGEQFWFNQIHIFSPYCTLQWARDDGRDAEVAAIERAFAEAPQVLDRVFHADGTEVSGEDALYLYNLHRRLAIPHRWMRGDILLLDNVRFGHGRRSFTGTRMIQVALIRHPIMDSHTSLSSHAAIM